MPEENENSEKKKSSSFSRIMLIATFALLAFMVFVYLTQSGMLNNLFASSPEETKKPAPALIYVFDQNFLVNLNDKDVLRYLKLTLGVEVPDQQVVDEIKNKIVEIRDAIITVLSAQSSEDLSTTEGKEKLKTLIADSINKFLTSGKVTAVYFVDFVMQ